MTSSCYTRMNTFHSSLVTFCCCFVKVWGISCEDRAVYFRQGVTSSELSGKTWKLISVPRDGDRSHSSASANSVQRWRSFSDHTQTKLIIPRAQRKRWLIRVIYIFFLTALDVSSAVRYTLSLQRVMWNRTQREDLQMEPPVL